MACRHRGVDLIYQKCGLQYVFNPMGQLSHEPAHRRNTHSSGPPSPPSPFHRFAALLQPEAPEIRIILVLSIISGILYLATPLTADAVVNNFAFGGEQPVYV